MCQIGNYADILKIYISTAVFIYMNAQTLSRFSMTVQE